MREILQRLLEQPPAPRLFSTVTAVLSDGRYTATDSQGRQITVDGEAGFLPGMAVVIQGARIVGIGSRPPVKTIYRV